MSDIFIKLVFIKFFLIFYSSNLFVFQSVLGKDGAVMGVTVTRMSMALHSQTLTHACDYSEGMLNIRL